HHRCVAWIAALASSVAAQIYATYALGWFLCFALLIAFALAMAMRSTRGQIASVLRAHWRAIALIAAVAAAALTPLGLQYLEAARAVGFRQFWEAEGMLPSLQACVYRGRETWPLGWAAGGGFFPFPAGGGGAALWPGPCPRGSGRGGAHSKTASAGNSHPDRSLVCVSAHRH